jgi:tetratricopeptide (TPR) repeat protein
MTMRGRLEMWSKTALIALTTAAAMAAGCASTPTKGAGKPGTMDEDDWAPGKGPSKMGAGMSEIPLTKKRTSLREVTEDQKNDFEKAAADYQRAKKNGALSPADCSSLANAFKRIADKNSVFLEARNNQATILLECGKKDEAISIWNSLANGTKPYAPALANLGYVAWQGGNKANAESLFNRSIQADPLTGSIYARINMAQILRERARTASGSDKRTYNDQAVRHLRTVLALDGNSLQAYAGLCYIYFDLGLPEAAKLVGAQATKRAQEIATGNFEEEATEEVTRRTSKRGKGKKGHAKEEEEKSASTVSVEGTGYTIEMKQALGVVLNTLGMISLSKKNYTEAIKNFKEAVISDPNLYEARLNLAALSLKFRNYQIAEENLREVLKAQPKNYEAIIGLGVALRGETKFDEAEAEYNKARSLDPQRGDAYFNLGILYQEYKAGSDKPMLQKAQNYYRDFNSRTNNSKLKQNAEKRIKDIDDTFAALKEAEQMMKEAEEMQRKAEEQQKKMEEEMKRMEAEGKRQEEEAKRQEEEAKQKEADEKAKKEEAKANPKADEKKGGAEPAAAAPAEKKAEASPAAAEPADKDGKK